MPDPASALETRAVEVVRAFTRAGLTLATAESCTGGKIAAAITDVAGSSAVLDRGFVTYSNAAKSEMLGVDPALIARHGAVSEPVAAAMAEGAKARSRAAVAVAVTGIAGPGGGTPEKPVGLVWFGLAGPAGTETRRVLFDGDRAAIRAQSVDFALGLLLGGLGGRA